MKDGRPPHRPDGRKLGIMAGFSFVNGWVDAVCISRYHAFATMMVGNMLTFGNSAVQFWLSGVDDPAIPWLPDPLFYVLLLLAFIFGVGLYRVLERRFGWTACHFAPAVVVWITLHDLLEVYMGPADAPPNRWNVLRLAPVFGIQDAMTVRNGFGSLPWCTTNNVVTIGFASADIFLGGATAEEWAKLVTSATMMTAMLLGAVSGAAFDAGMDLDLEGWPGKVADYDIAVVAPVLGLLFYLNERCFGKPPSQIAAPLLDANKPGEAAQPACSRSSSMHPVESNLQLSG